MDASSFSTNLFHCEVKISPDANGAWKTRTQLLWCCQFLFEEASDISIFSSNYSGHFCWCQFYRESTLHGDLICIFFFSSKPCFFVYKLDGFGRVVSLCLVSSKQSEMCLVADYWQVEWLTLGLCKSCISEAIQRGFPYKLSIRVRISDRLSGGGV